MGGIVGYVGARPARAVLLDRLEKLEYRGYDSAGISVLTEAGIESVRAVGHLSALRDRVLETAPARDGGGVALAPDEAPSTAGVGHTRWATHGKVTEENAHPHFDTQD